MGMIQTQQIVVLTTENTQLKQEVQDAKKAIVELTAKLPQLPGTPEKERGFLKRTIIAPIAEKLGLKPEGNKND